MKNRKVTLAIAAALTFAVACSKDSTAPVTTNTNTTGTPAPTAPINNNITLTATMTGAKEIPVNTSTGTGTFTARLDTMTNILSYNLTFTGLSAGVNNGHIHGPALATANAGTTINFNTQAGAQFSFGQTSGTGSGISLLASTTQITATINGDSLRKLILAGLTYVNIHTTAFPGGEIRGQITRQ